MNPIVIIGAGLTGLSTAYHLKDNYVIFEKESVPGGLCRSHKLGQFTFDYTGHFLHIRDIYVNSFIQNLLGDNIKSFERRSFIYSKGVYTEYPFQANTFGLPKEVVKECLMGFIEAWMFLRTEKSDGQKATNKKQVSSIKYQEVGEQEQGTEYSEQRTINKTSFQDWILQTFGTGIAKHFMIPYNQKLYQTDLREITSEWVSWSVPQPTLEEVINGAIGIKNRQFGYNSSFYYPERGGIQSLVDSIFSKIKNCVLQKEVVEINLKTKTIIFKDGDSINYETIISTIPLPQLLRSIKDVPNEIRDVIDKLRYVSVYNVNIGVDRADISDKHWIYFPEDEFIFYRVGFPHNFSFDSVPEGAGSMYIEISHLPQNTMSEDEILTRTIDDLIKCKILHNKNEVLVQEVIDIPFGYVIYDFTREKVLNKIFQYLAGYDIYSIGRYGEWKYSAMQDAILDGKRIAEKVGG